MGIMKTIFRARAQRAAEIKAAKVRAKEEVKSAAKLELRKSKLLARQEQQLLKDERKTLKSKRKHELKMAEAQLAQIKAGRFNTKNVLRYSAALRTVAPVLLPLIYKGIVALREYNTSKQSSQLAISGTNPANENSEASQLNSRISQLEKSLTQYKLPSGFQKDVQARLKELRFAVSNASYFSPDKQAGAHRAVAADLDQIEKEIMAQAL